VTSAGSVHLAGATGKASAKSSGGGIELGVMEADTRAETSAGSISIKTAKAALVVKTSGGGIHAGELDGPADLQTSAGSIHVASARGKLEANTSGGGIELDDLRGSVLAHTSAGSITAAFTAQPDAACRLSTSGGGIQVALKPGLAFDLDAKTSGGSVKTDIPVTAVVSGEAKHGVLQGKINGGGKPLELKTSAGNISIRAGKE
jgi:DUF4097 and DUF4098 domain-containing protein YvlB